MVQAVRLFGPPLPRLALLWADAAYAGAFVEEMREQFGWTVQIVKRSAEQPLPPGFPVHAHRWMVERSFGWFGGLRRLANDDEYELESSEALIYVAMSHLLLRRLTRRTSSPSRPAGGCSPRFRGG